MNLNINETEVRERISIKDIDVNAYTIPTDAPESDGTLQWNSTTIVVVTIEAGGKTGIGYTYGSSAIAYFIHHTLRELVIGQNAMNIIAITNLLIHQVRNNSNTGLCMMAISAIDTALWDLKAKLFDMPLAVLLGMQRPAMSVYGSGGFTSYTDAQQEEQLSGWVENGISNVKIKIGRHPGKDLHRIKQARKTIGEDTGLFVDANAAYTVKQAVYCANQFAKYNISWFEEPVNSDNLEGLHFVRQHAAPVMNIAAGEYGYNLSYFKNMLSAGAVDVLQADATRCGGITGFLKAGDLAEAYMIPFSSHCAPALHLHAALSLPAFFIAEYFHDHVRIEQMLFDGVQTPVDGKIKPDLTRAGMGIEFKYTDAEQYKV